jgi:hypothetical protein
MSNIIAYDINLAPIYPALGQFDCMIVVRIYDTDRVYYVCEKFGRN